MEITVNEEDAVQGVVTDKKCTNCKRVKPITEFYKRASSPDGHQSWCKQCTLEHDPRYSDKLARDRKIGAASNGVPPAPAAVQVVVVVKQRDSVKEVLDVLHWLLDMPQNERDAVVAMVKSYEMAFPRE